MLNKREFYPWNYPSPHDVYFLVQINKVLINWQKLRRKQMRIKERQERGGAGQRSGKSSQDSRLEMSYAIRGGASWSAFPEWAKPSCWKEVEKSQELRKSRHLSIRNSGKWYKMRLRSLPGQTIPCCTREKLEFYSHHCWKRRKGLKMYSNVFGTDALRMPGPLCCDWSLGGWQPRQNVLTDEWLALERDCREDAGILMSFYLGHFEN